MLPTQRCQCQSQEIATYTNKPQFRKSKFRCSIVVSISACHAEDPGSIPGGGEGGSLCFWVGALSLPPFVSSMQGQSCLPRHLYAILSTARFRCSFVCLRLPSLCSVLRLAFVCLSVLCSATPSPSQGRQSGHLMISSPSWGAPKHSLSEGKLETKSSEDSCEGCNLKPIRFEPQIFSNFAGKHS